MLEQLANRRVLMLQGPMGPFFANVAKRLRKQGATITKVNFNAGDHLYYRGPEVVAYRSTFGVWPSFFEALVRDRGIEAVVLFGDCRPYHRVAIERAKRLGVDVFVFEEGYLRPDFVTLERGGVTGYSSIPRDPEFFRRVEPAPLPEPRPVGQTLPAAALYAAGYAVTQRLLHSRYPHYHHHRDVRPLRQAGCWLRGGVRRVLHTVRDRGVDDRLAGGQHSPFFLVPLQVHLDSQMQHCPFDSVESFIRVVVKSFAGHAPPEAKLVFKHHPFDRPYRDYGKLMGELRDRYRLGGRLLYVDVINLPAALREAKGTVVINSTVGMSSIHHGTPVKCLGTAVYDLEGLTFQGPLEEFWRNPGEVDEEIYERYRYWLRVNNQINGTVWGDVWDEVAVKDEPVRRVLRVA